MFFTLIVLIIAALFNDMPPMPDVPETPSLPVAPIIEQTSSQHECALQVLSAEYPDSQVMPARSNYVSESAYNVAKAKSINGGSLVNLEDGSVCSL